MKVKKINAILSLLTVAALFVHIGYTVFAYLTLYYNPTLKNLMSYPFMILTCLHAVLSMVTMMFFSDGSKLDLYPQQNVETIIQRVSAVLIIPLLILHLNTFSLMQSCAESGNWVVYVLLTVAQTLFYAASLLHVAFSVPRALITLGRISTEEQKKKADRIVRIVCAVVFVVSAFAVIKGELAMFLPAGGAA